MKQYRCPKCKAAVNSEKPLTYCVCGGKYENKVIEMLGKMGLEELFGKPRK